MSLLSILLTNKATITFALIQADRTATSDYKLDVLNKFLASISTQAVSWTPWNAEDSATQPDVSLYCLSCFESTTEMHLVAGSIAFTEVDDKKSEYKFVTNDEAGKANFWRIQLKKPEQRFNLISIQPISVGETISKENSRLESCIKDISCEVKKSPSVYKYTYSEALKLQSDLLEKVAITYISPNTILSPQSFKARELVKRGQQLNIIYKSPAGISISFQGISQQSGAQNQIIRVKPSNHTQFQEKTNVGNEIYAKIVSENEVIVE